MSELQLKFQTKAQLDGALELEKSLERQIAKLQALEAAGGATKKQLDLLSTSQAQLGNLRAAIDASAQNDEMREYLRSLREAGGHSEDLYRKKKDLVWIIKTLKHELHGLPGAYEAIAFLKHPVVAVSLAFGVLANAYHQWKSQIEAAHAESNLAQRLKELDVRTLSIARSASEAGEAYKSAMATAAESANEAANSIQKRIEQLMGDLTTVQKLLKSKFDAEEAEAEASEEKAGWTPLQRLRAKNARSVTRKLADVQAHRDARQIEIEMVEEEAERMRARKGEVGARWKDAEDEATKLEEGTGKQKERLAEAANKKYTRMFDDLVGKGGNLEEYAEKIKKEREYTSKSTSPFAAGQEEMLHHAKAQEMQARYDVVLKAQAEAERTRSEADAAAVAVKEAKKKAEELKKEGTESEKGEVDRRAEAAKLKDKDFWARKVEDSEIASMHRQNAANVEKMEAQERHRQEQEEQRKKAQIQQHIKTLRDRQKQLKGGAPEFDNLQREINALMKQLGSTGERVGNEVTMMGKAMVDGLKAQNAKLDAMGEQIRIIKNRLGDVA